MYSNVSWDEFNAIRQNPNQTRIFDMLSRQQSQSGVNGGEENFFAKRAKSLENAFGTTGAVLAGGIIEQNERNRIDEQNKRFNQSLDDIYKSAGFNNIDDYYNAKEAAERDAFGRIGFDIDDYWDKRANADIAGDKDTISRLDASYNEAKAKIGNDENLARFNDIQERLKNQASANQTEAKESADKYKDYLKNSYIGQKTNQDQGKFAGSAINTLSTMFDVLAPGAGVLANSVQGGIEGVADELEQNGLKNFDWNRAGQNALIGATTGAVTGGLNRGISNQLAKNGGNLFKGGNAITRGLNNLGSSTTAGRIGSTLATGAARGAVSGAVGGATGAGLSAAMNGQDVLGSAIEGAQRGLGQGALAGGVMAGAGLAKNSLQNAMNGGQPTETELTNRPMQQEDVEPKNGIVNRQNIQPVEEDTGLYPAFEPGNDRIQQRNKLQSIGDQLMNDAKSQKNSALYDTLDARTAQRSTKTGAVEELSRLGVKPDNYLESAKTSDYINNLMTNLAENSEVKVMAPGLLDELSPNKMNVYLPTEKAEKTYNEYIKRITADGSTPDQYSAGNLLKITREFGKAANDLRYSRAEGAAEVAQALTNAKKILRNVAADALEREGITGNVANDQIAKGLAKLGASKEIQDYYTQDVDGKAPTISDYIRRSSLFEQARDMGTQMDAEQYTRSASKVATNPLTKMWNASGLDKPVNTILKNTVAPVASGITKVASKALKGAGDIEAGIKNVLTGSDTPIPTNRTPVDTGNVIDTAYNPATRVYEAIGRTEGLTNAEQARTANYITNAVQESNGGGQPGNTLESLAMPVSTTEGTSVYNAMYGTPSAGSRITSPSGNSYFQATGDYWTDVLARALTSAIEADDVDAFASLFAMYQDAASKLDKQSAKASTGNQKITATQQRANAAMNSLNRLSQMTPDLGYNLSGIPVIGGIATLGGNDYEGEAKSLAQQIGYMVSGANIKEEEAYNIGKAYVPQPFDSEQTRKNKLNRAYDIIRQYQNGYAVDDNTNLEA